MKHYKLLASALFDKIVKAKMPVGFSLAGRYTLVWVVFFSFLAIPASYGDSIFDRAKSKWEGFKEGREDKKAQAEEAKILDLEQQLKARLPNDLPSTWSWKIVNDPVWDAEVIVAEAGRKNAPTLFLVHGLGQVGLRDWLDVMPALEKDYHIVLFDLPGFGGSGKPPGRYSPTNYAKLLSHLKGIYSPSKKISLIGHSMGGAVSLRYAAMFPQEPEQLVLVDAAGVLERTAFIKHSAKMPINMATTPDQLKGFLTGIQDMSSNFIELINRLPDPTGYIQSDDIWAKIFNGKPNVNAAFALISEDFSAAIYELSTPVSVIWGENDRVTPLRTADLLAKHLPVKVYKVIEGAGHVPMKTHTQSFNKVLREALQAKEIENSIADNASNESKGVLRCKNESGKTIEGGYYKEIHIRECTAITLRNVKTDKLVLKGSVVSLHNVEVKGKGTAIYIRKSVLRGTNLTVEGKVGLYTSKSRVDIAGGEIIGTKSAVVVKGKSQLLFSVSRLKSPRYTGYVHGNYRLKKTTLESKL